MGNGFARLGDARFATALARGALVLLVTGCGSRAQTETLPPPPVEAGTGWFLYGATDRQVGVASPEAYLFAADLSAPELPHRRLSEPGEVAGGAANWSFSKSPDGQRLTAVAAKSGADAHMMKIIDFSSGAPVAITRIEESGPAALPGGWSPDSRRFAFSRPTTNGVSIHVVSVSGDTSAHTESVVDSVPGTQAFMAWLDNDALVYSAWQTPDTVGSLGYVRWNQGQPQPPVRLDAMTQIKGCTAPVVGHGERFATVLFDLRGVVGFPTYFVDLQSGTTVTYERSANFSSDLHWVAAEQLDHRWFVQRAGAPDSEPIAVIPAIAPNTWISWLSSPTRLVWLAPDGGGVHVMTLNEEETVVTDIPGVPSDVASVSLSAGSWLVFRTIGAQSYLSDFRGAQPGPVFPVMTESHEGFPGQFVHKFSLDGSRVAYSMLGRTSAQVSRCVAQADMAGLRNARCLASCDTSDCAFGGDAEFSNNGRWTSYTMSRLNPPGSGSPIDSTSLYIVDLDNTARAPHLVVPRPDCTSRDCVVTRPGIFVP